MALACGLSVFIVRQTDGFIEGDIRSYIHSIPFVSIPVNIIFSLSHKLSDMAGLDSGYLTHARSAISTTDLAKKIGRYYMALKVPILAAIASLITALLVRILTHVKKTPPVDTGHGVCLGQPAFV